MIGRVYAAAMGWLTQVCGRRAALAILFGFSILLWGVLANGAIELVSMALGELSEHTERTILLVTAVAWLPLAFYSVWARTNPGFMPQREDAANGSAPPAA